MMREKYLLKSCSRSRKKANKEEQGNGQNIWLMIWLILDNDKYKKKPLLANVKNIKNSQYYHRVIEELKERCSKRGEKLPFNVEHTREKFKRCINVCRDAVMKVKTSSEIKHFLQDKKIGSWFVVEVANPIRLLNREEKLLKLMAKNLILKIHDYDVCQDETSQGSP